MPSVMAIRSEVFGSCVGEIDISVEVENGDVLLCCGWKYLSFIEAVKAAQDSLRRWAMVPGVRWRLGAFGLIEEIKSPCVCRGFCM